MALVHQPIINSQVLHAWSRAPARQRRQLKEGALENGGRRLQRGILGVGLRSLGSW